MTASHLNTQHPPAQNAAGTMSYASAGAIPAYANFGQRLLAWIVDWFALGAMQFAVLMLLGLIAILIEHLGLDTETVQIVTGFAVFTVMVLVSWLYYALMEASRWQATLGKMALGIQVDDVDGGPATFTQTSFRFFLKIVSALLLGFGFLMAAFTRRRQALHDIGANCIVIRKPARPVIAAPVPPPLPPAPV